MTMQVNALTFGTFMTILFKLLKYLATLFTSNSANLLRNFGGPHQWIIPKNRLPFFQIIFYLIRNMCSAKLEVIFFLYNIF